MKPFSQASENNRQPILEVLEKHFTNQQRILEIGSGTGQHAVYFPQYLQHVIWQTSDRIENHSGINQWIDGFPIDNLKRPVELDVENPDNWNNLARMAHMSPFDGVFTANTVHIMPWSNVEKMFAGVGELFSYGGGNDTSIPHRFAVYGPFNRDGAFTSAGNAQFHRHLQERDPLMGIRNDHAVFNLAKKYSLKIAYDIDMPANNRILIFDYVSFT